MEIARGVAEVTHLPIVTDAVERVSFTSSQTKKSLRERMENVENAFQPTGKVNLEGKHILMVDDIVTSGATICACVKALQQSANIRVSVFSLGVVK
jgi:predicted amidophosphoribosyltransferase